MKPLHLNCLKRMLWMVIAVTFVMLSLTKSHATILTDDFKTTNTAMNSTNVAGGTGWAMPWISGSSQTKINTSASIAYTNGGYNITQESASGMFYTSTPIGASMRGGVRSNSVPLTGTVWFSTLMTNSATSQSYIHVNSANNGTGGTLNYNPSSQYNIGIMSNSFVVGYGYNSANNSVASFNFTPSNNVVSGSHLILGRITFQAAGNLDRIEVWIDPTQLTNLPSPLFSEVTRDIGANLFIVGVAANGNSAIDAIRFSDGGGDPVVAYYEIGRAHV